MSIGIVQKRILMLLLAGLALGFSRSPRQSFYILRTARKEWRDINYKQLRRSVMALHNFGVVKTKRNNDGTMEIVLTEKGKKIAKLYSLDSLEIKKMRRWDKKWRMVIFDIPEKKRQVRDIFRFHLKRLEFYELQHSVWVHPYKCTGEIQYLIYFFRVSKYVHLIEAAVISDDEFLKKKFKP